VKKLSTPHDSVACRTIFSCNNLKWLFSVWCYQSITSLWIDHHLSSLQHYFSSLKFVGIDWCSVLSQSPHSISIILRSFLFQTFCCLFYAVFRIIVIFNSRMLWYTVEFMVYLMTARRSVPVATKQAQLISPPPQCFKVCTRHLCWYAVFGFLLL